MPETYTLQLSALNAVPGVSGIEDVDVTVPQVGDIETALEDAVPTVEDIATAVNEEVSGGFEDIQQGLPGDGLDIDLPLADEVADAVLDRLDVEPGLFGPIDDPLDEALLQAVEDGLENLDGLDVGLDDLQPELIEETADDVQDVLDDLQDIIDAVGDVQSDLQNIEVPSETDIAETVVEELVSAIEELPAGRLLTEPRQFVLEQVEAWLQDNLSEETKQLLRDEQ